MEIIEVEQGSAEWHIARAGAITASMFAEIRKRVNGLTEQQAKYVDAVRAGQEPAEAAKQAGYKKAPSGEKLERALAGEPVGEYTAAAKDYAFRLAVERIGWEPLDGGFETWAMKRGHELEPEARAAHAHRIGRQVERAGLVLTDDHLFGASADGLIGDDGGAEYKCLVSPERLRTIIIDRDLEEFRDQVQGGLWLTGRTWWHFVLYCPALAPAGKELFIHEVERDDDYIEAMEQDLVAFDRLVARFQHAIENAETWHSAVESEPELAAPVATRGITDDATPNSNGGPA